MNSSIRRILVPLDPSAYTVAAMRHAGRLARAHFSQVDGLAWSFTNELIRNGRTALLLSH
jgi:hypothetical protein